MKDNFDDKDTLIENEGETAQEDTNSAVENSGIGADIIRGHINTIILRSLYERDKYGYEIMNDIERKSHSQYSLKQPTLYSALKRLENQGYIIAYWKTDEVSSGGRRKYFTLTDSGREITEKNLAEWEYSRTIIDNLISDRAFDFSQPAPTPVDFTILRNSVSRVRTKRVGDGEDDEDETEDSATAVKTETTEQTVSENVTETEKQEATEEAATETAKEEKPSEQGNYATVYQTLVSENDQFVEQSTTQEENGLLYQMLAQNATAPKQGEQPASEESGEKELTEEEIAQRVKQHENYLRLIAETPIKDAPEKTEAVTEETVIEEQPAPPPQPAQPKQRLYTEEEVEEILRLHNYQPKQHAQPTEKLYTEEEVAEIIRQYDSYQPAPPPPPSQPKQKLYTEEEVEERIRQHDNYLRLISEPVEEEKPEDVVPNSESINTNELLYNVKPKTERDYKNLINGIYDRAIANGAVETNYATRTPKDDSRNRKNEQTYANPIVERGAADGVRITPSYEYYNRNTYAVKTTYNKGLTLFMCSGIVLFITFVEFLFCLLFRDNLRVNVAYPIVILLIGIVQFAVFGILFWKGYGANCTKPMTNTYLIQSIIFTALLILIICVSSFLFNINFTVASDVMKLIVVPTITVLNIVIFAISFKLLVK